MKSVTRNSRLLGLLMNGGGVGGGGGVLVLVGVGWGVVPGSPHRVTGLKASERSIIK